MFLIKLSRFVVTFQYYRVAVERSYSFVASISNASCFGPSHGVSSGI